jgi:hypothetical protein
MRSNCTAAIGLVARKEKVAKMIEDMERILNLARREGATPSKWLVPRRVAVRLRSDMARRDISQILGVPTEIANTPDGKFALVIHMNDRTD